MGAKAQQGRRKQDVGVGTPALSRAKRLEPVNHPAKFNRLTRWSLLADAVPAICTDTASRLLYG